jgi:hypothetical protein
MLASDTEPPPLSFALSLGALWLPLLPVHPAINMLAARQIAIATIFLCLIDCFVIFLYFNEMFAENVTDCKSATGGKI